MGLFASPGRTGFGSRSQPVNMPRKLNLDSSLETFGVFDFLMSLIAFFGAVILLCSVYCGIWWLAILMLLGELTLVWGIKFEILRLTVTTYRLALVREPKVWIRAVFASDWHACKDNSADWFEKVSTRINSLRPDVIFLGGDYVVWKSADAFKLWPIKTLKAPYGIYSVMGNHDYLDDPHSVLEKIKSYGVHDITNACLTARIQGADLQIVGLDDALLGLPMVLPLRSEEKVPRLVLSHSPDSVLDLKEGQVDLLLAGHTHGGQVRLPFIGCLAVPSKLGCRADQGEKYINGIKTIISRGLGQVGCRARLFCPPEILFLEIGI